MSGLGIRPTHRIKGQAALTQRLMRLLLAVHRFGKHRARTADQMRWAARTIDALQVALDEARR